MSASERADVCVVEGQRVAIDVSIVVGDSEGWVRQAARQSCLVFIVVAVVHGNTQRIAIGVLRLLCF